MKLIITSSFFPLYFLFCNTLLFLFNSIFFLLLATIFNNEKKELLWHTKSRQNWETHKLKEVNESLKTWKTTLRRNKIFSSNHNLEIPKFTFDFSHSFTCFLFFFLINILTLKSQSFCLNLSLFFVLCKSLNKKW